MSRARRWAEMGDHAWDEWTPEEIAVKNKGRPREERFTPGLIPGVVMTPVSPPPGLATPREKPS